MHVFIKVDYYFNTRSVFQWILIELHNSLIYIFIGFSRNKYRKLDLIPALTLSIMFCPFGDYLHLIYSKMSLKHITDISKSVAYFDIHLGIDT